jgi:hypothetical protein
VLRDPRLANELVDRRHSSLHSVSSLITALRESVRAKPNPAIRFPSRKERLAVAEDRATRAIMP